MAGPGLYYFFPTDYFVPPLHSSIGDHKNPNLPPQKTSQMIKNTPPDDHDHDDHYHHDCDHNQKVMKMIKKRRNLAVKTSCKKSEEILHVYEKEQQHYHHPILCISTKEQHQ